MGNWLFGKDLLFDCDFCGRLGDFLRCFDVGGHLGLFLDWRLSLQWFLSHDFLDCWLLGCRHFNLSNQLFFFGNDYFRSMLNFTLNIIDHYFLHLRFWLNDRGSLLNN